ncbi:MAG: inorganic phosphate transporter [Pseudomonadota bacterium]
MELTLVNFGPLVYLTLALGLYMAWGIGANDFSNSVGPAVGAKVLSVREAIIVAIIFELAGALFYGAHVTETLIGNIIDLSAGDSQPMLLVHGMLASLLAAALWLTLASALGWPVSTTHSIIGAMVGFALVGIGSSAVHWDGIGRILGSWVISPLAGGLLAFLIMKSFMLLILRSPDPVKRVGYWAPLYVFLAGFLVCQVTFSKGLGLGLGLDLDLDLDDTKILLLSAFIGAGMAFIGIMVTRNRSAENVERAFAPMTVFTVCAMAFAHGSNDVANSVGPIMLILDLLHRGAISAPAFGVPVWIFLLGGTGIALGVATFGFRVVRTISRDITELTPCRAFAVALASTATVVLASGAALPVSTTHTVVGAVLGVGLASGRGAVHYPVINKILIAWLITVPFTAFLAAILFLVARAWPAL